MKYILTFCLVLALAFKAASQKRIYSTRSYSVSAVGERKTYRVVLQEYIESKMSFFLYDDNKLIDSLTIQGCRGIDSIRLDLHEYIVVSFNVMGGSGTRVTKTVVVCCSGGRLRTALFILSRLESYLSEVYNSRIDSMKVFDESEIFNVHLIFKRLGAITKVGIIETRNRKSKFKPLDNISYEVESELQFDSVSVSFVSGYSTLRGRYMIVDLDGKTVERFLDYYVPSIRFRDDEYFMIENRWHIAGKSGYLLVM